MTHTKIIDMAKEAAANAFVAFDTTERPSVAIAYDFTRHARWEEYEGDDESAQVLWDSMAISQQEWSIFRIAYDAELARLDADCLEATR